MSKVLIAYTTNASSTQEIAEEIGKTIRDAGHAADVTRVESCSGVSGYDAVVIGAPMILGWHREARKFIRKYRADLARVPVACFCTMMSLTQTQGTTLAGDVLSVDPWLPKAPKNPRRLGIKESYATADNYLRPLLNSAPEVKPSSIAFLGGKLELFRLKWWQMLFVMVIIQAQPGDLRNWDYINQWTKEFVNQSL